MYIQTKLVLHRDDQVALKTNKNQQMHDNNQHVASQKQS